VGGIKKLMPSPINRPTIATPMMVIFLRHIGVVKSFSPPESPAGCITCGIE
jgi:hypothetical protein